jgi:hypothetical protein
MHDAPAVLVAFDVSNTNSGQVEHDRRSVVQARGVSVCCLSNSKTSRGHGRPTLSTARATHDRRCPVKVEGPAKPTPGVDLSGLDAAAWSQHHQPNRARRAMLLTGRRSPSEFVFDVINNEEEIL